jgi:hypothetical protein
MSDYYRIERLIREARLQRSVAMGEALGGALAKAWLAVAQAGNRVAEGLRHRETRRGKVAATN